MKKCLHWAFPCTLRFTSWISQSIVVHSRYGQMTAGSYCYIGPQGIVHGTTVSQSSILLSQLLQHKFHIVDFAECWTKISRC